VPARQVRYRVYRVLWCRAEVNEHFLPAPQAGQLLAPALQVCMPVGHSTDLAA